MANRVEEPVQAGQAIYGLIVEADNDDKKDLRAEVRFPFFRSLSIRVDDRLYSAFSRDISDSGIGLLHDFELQPREVEISIPSKSGWIVRVRTQIIWSCTCGDGWYVSGGHFIGLMRAGAEVK